MAKVKTHLGGNFGADCIDLPVLDWIANVLKCKSFLDIGCGLGGIKLLMQERGVKRVLGIDGDPAVQGQDNLIFHDFSVAPVVVMERFDVSYSHEVLEHIYPQYLPNIMPAFQQSKTAVISHGMPGQGGHHHVNCQPHEYWIDVFNQYGFDHDADATEHVRDISRLFFKNTPINRVTTEELSVAQYQLKASDVGLPWWGFGRSGLVFKNRNI